MALREMTVINETDIEMLNKLRNEHVGSYSMIFDVAKLEDEKPDLLKIHFCMARGRLQHCDSRSNVRYGPNHDSIEPCAVCEEE